MSPRFRVNGACVIFAFSVVAGSLVVAALRAQTGVLPLPLPSAGTANKPKGGALEITNQALLHGSSGIQAKGFWGVLGISAIDGGFGVGAWPRARTLRVSTAGA